MKRLVTLLFCFALVCTLCSCGSETINGVKDTGNMLDYN